MNELICEMCGSNNIIKQDGLYICQSCGTKYSPEEAKKMMQGETVEIKGTVKIDRTKELENLYTLARYARDIDNEKDVKKYYKQILDKEPTSWEAHLYLNKYTGVEKHIPLILSLIKNNVNPNEYETILEEIYTEFTDVWYALDTNRFTILGDNIIKIFGEKYAPIAVKCWKYDLDIASDKKEILEYTKKVQKYEPDYQYVEKKGGCYVATSVYGSYDCPEVWTLRRFRDNTLEKSIFGRLFIKTYYATSPTLVKYFGDKKIFNSLFKPILDKFVKKLNSNGVESSFYIDK